MKDDITTEENVRLDIIAALDMYTGLIGSETTIIEKIEYDGRIELFLSDGSAYRLTVAQSR